MRYHSDKGHKFDFLVDTEKNPRLRRYLEGMGAHCLEYDYAWVYFLGLEIYVPWQGVILSGYARVQGRLVLGPCVLEDCPDGVGDWVALSLSANQLEVTTDPFSSSPVFYGHGLVSNSMHLLYECVRETGQLSTNYSALAANFATRHIFSGQSSTFHSALEGVYQLPAFSRLVVDRRINVIEERQDTSYVDLDEYWELIDRGARELVDNISGALRTGRRVISALTGGRDSRLVYAAILAGGHCDKVAFTTKDIGRDLKVAASILGRFGGEFVGPEHRIIKGQLVSEVLDRVFSHNFFNYHSIQKLVRPVTHHYPYPIFLLGGSFGELYRGYYHGIVRSIQERNPNVTTDVAVSDWVSRCAESSVARTDLVTRDLSKTMTQLADTDVSRGFIAHYLNFRSKYHFGNKIHRQEKVDIHPLQSKSLLELSLRVPADVLFSGRIAFDVTRHLCEELAYYEYDKPARHSYQDFPYHKPSRFDGQTLAFTSAEYERGMESRRRADKSSKPKKPVAVNKGASDFFGYAAGQLPELIERCYTRDLFQTDKAKILKKVEEHKKKRSNKLYTYFSKFSQLDMYLNQ